MTKKFVQNDFSLGCCTFIFRTLGSRPTRAGTPWSRASSATSGVFLNAFSFLFLASMLPSHALLYFCMHAYFIIAAIVILTSKKYKQQDHGLGQPVLQAPFCILPGATRHSRASVSCCPGLLQHVVPIYTPSQARNRVGKTMLFCSNCSNLFMYNSVSTRFPRCAEARIIAAYNIEV